MILSLLLAAVTPSAPIAPKGPWEVNVQEDFCRLGRVYPTAKGDTLLIFQPLLDLPSMELYVGTPGGSGTQYKGKFKVTVQPGDRVFDGNYYSVTPPKSKTRFTRLFIDRVALDGLRDGDTMSIEAKPVSASFAIVRPEKARPALDGCIANLKKSWGIDTARDAQAVTPLDGNPARYFTAEAYPKEALRQGIYGRVIALLNIDPAGLVANCRIVSSAGALLNDGTCLAAKRIRFKPPVDATGKALASTYLLPVRWALPGSE